MSRIRRAPHKRPALAAAALAATLALTATACGSDDGSGKKTDAKPAASDSPQGGNDSGDDGDGLGLRDKLPRKLPGSFQDLDQWRNGGWKNWDKDKWVREAKEFANPYLKGHWDLGRMKKAEDNEKKVPKDIASTSGAADTAEPRPVRAEAVKTPYTRNAAPAGKVFMDTPEGPMVCSGTVVHDPRHPGKSNLVATAGHCVHSGRSGGWLRNITFIPAFNDRGLDMPSVNSAPPQEVAPYGEWWVRWAQTSNYWIQKGEKSGGGGSQQDFAVLSVQPVNKSGKSLEETVGNAIRVSFKAPSLSRIRGVSNYGYPAAPPFDGAKMYSCTDKPGALTIDPSQPALYRIGCTMTGGSSGGAWLVEGSDGKPELISVNSIGPHPATWLAGPRLGATAKAVFDAASRKG